MKEKIELEYPINCSPQVLFPRLSTPSGLSEWFADNVNLKGNVFTFIWEGFEQQAELIGKKTNKYVRFRWVEEEDHKAFFEFRIKKDDLTGDVSLFIIDFADNGEKEDSVELWDSQISELKRKMGLL